MPKSRIIARVEPRPPRFRNVITTIMLVLMTVMIVRDILIKRWGASPPSPDITRRLP
jgi:hypothetical protein